MLVGSRVGSCWRRDVVEQRRSLVVGRFRASIIDYRDLPLPRAGVQLSLDTIQRLTKRETFLRGDDDLFFLNL